MSRQWILVAAVLGIAAALPMQPQREAEKIIQLFKDSDLGRNNAIESLIIDLLEDLREVMVAGALDPLRVDRIYLDDSIIPLPGAHLELVGLEVSRLSGFELAEVRVENTNIILQYYHMQIQLEFPVIDVETEQYDLLVDVFGLSVFGKGEAKLSVTRPWVRVDTNLNVRLGFLALYLNMRDLHITFGLDDIQVGITGIFNDPLVSDFVNKFLRYFILDLVEFFADDLSNVISPLLLDLINDILSDINLIDIIG